MLPTPAVRAVVRPLLIGLMAAVLGLLPACAHAPLAGVAASASGSSVASAVPGADSGLRVVALGSLPREAADTYRLIGTGGPYPNRQDGTVFGNREKVLPQERLGYYHEYTVATPGSSDRGARRIITGSSREYYYTGDHYASFVVVDVSR